jgi:hypothetical protein
MRKLILIALFSFITNIAFAAPSAELWSYWKTHNENNQSQISHQLFDGILKTYLTTSHTSKVHLFRYNKVTINDKKKLTQYLNQLQAIKITNYSRLEQKAYWINLYNALTVQVILKHYPVKSILKINISPGFFSRGPWGAKLLTVEGEKISLNDIEHRILRPIWKDNRIHYAVNCASYSCPNLASKTYTAQSTEQLLHEGAKQYINHKRGVTFDNDNDLVLSKIYDWYQIDFGDNEKNLIKHLIKYANPELKRKLLKFDGDIDYKYNWNLNQP